MSMDEDTKSPIPGLLAIHVRRGDYEYHCQFLGSFNAEFYSAFTLPFMLDKFVPGEGPDGLSQFLVHCWPSITQIIHRIKELMLTPEAQGLERIYVMTNGERAWVQELKSALKETGFFRSVATSRDLKLSKEQKYIAQAGDMAVGQRAQFFIGNPWSSMTGDIVLLRLASGWTPGSCRAW